MIRIRRARRDLTLREVLHRWVLREAEKEQYPDAEPSNWSEERLPEELETTYEEPVGYAAFRTPEWTSFVISGDEVGKFNPYPSIGCNAFTGHGTLSRAIDRLETEDIAANYPDAVEKIARIRRLYPDRDLGAVVVRQYKEFWPPVALDGNHRAWAAVQASWDDVDVELTVHFGHELPLEELPLDLE